MQYIPNVIFALILVLGIGYFVQNVRQLIANIKLGKTPVVQGDKKERLKNVAYIAFGQSKMFKRPISGLLHLVVYLGFVIINIEVLEIVLDGLLGTHRLFFFPGTYIQCTHSYFRNFCCCGCSCGRRILVEEKCA